jgi:glycosyltransferase involved in cell wall biosynthesis
VTRRLSVVSHAGVLPVNQVVYRVLVDRGWRVSLVVPNRWRHEYQPGPFPPRPLVGMEDSFVALPVVLPGKPQRHFYRVRPAAVLRRLRPDVMFVEEESFSIPAFQWGHAATRLGIPFGVQAAETLDRPLPFPALRIRRWVLAHADFVASRSPRAADLARQWGAHGAVSVAPHAVPPWSDGQQGETSGDAVFTVGFAGRLVPEKGVDVLVRAVLALQRPVRLLVAGDGPLASSIRELDSPGLAVELTRGVPHERMDAVFRQMDVLVVPSRTTERWAEQFGRVLVEAMSLGVPVIGSDSGEIPWVIGITGGGLLVREGDHIALGLALEELRKDPTRRRELGARGQRAVSGMFSPGAAATALEQILDETLETHS